jgi:hypothetical protein
MGPVESLFSDVLKTKAHGQTDVAVQLAVLGSALLPALVVLYVGVRIVLREGSSYRRLFDGSAAETLQPDRCLTDSSSRSARITSQRDPVRLLLERVVSRLRADDTMHQRIFSDNNKTKCAPTLANEERGESLQSNRCPSRETSGFTPKLV